MGPDQASRKGAFWPCPWVYCFIGSQYYIWEVHTLNGAWREKTCLWGFVNNTGADQPAHLRSLISAFVIHILEITISKLATSKIFIFLASLCSWGDWFETRFVGNPEDRFCRGEAQIKVDERANNSLVLQLLISFD